jgi:hypothetical protein
MVSHYDCENIPKYKSPKSKLFSSQVFKIRVIQPVLKVRKQAKFCLEMHVQEVRSQTQIVAPGPNLAVPVYAWHEIRLVLHF